MQDFLMDEINAAAIPVPPESKHLGIIAMGMSGTGKTTLIGTAPKPLIFDFDHGLMTLDAMGLQEGKDYYKIKFDKFSLKTINTPQGEKKKMSPLQNIEKLLQILCYAADQEGPFAEGGVFADVETLALDGYTSLSRYYLYEVQCSLGQDYRKDKAGFDGYGQILKVFDDVAEMLCQCKEHYNIIGTCMPKGVQRPGSSRDDDMVYVPDMDGSFKGVLGKTLDEFYYLEAKRLGGKVKYIVNTKPLNTVDGLKSRSQLPQEMEGITFPEIQAEFLKAHAKNSGKGA